MLKNTNKEELIVCSKCKEEKVPSEFSKCSANKNGLQYQCKECASKYMKKLRANYRKINESKEPTIKEQKCNCCGEVKSSSEFFRKASNKSGIL